MKIIFTFILLACLATTASARHLHLEKYYQEKWCAEQGGQTEVVLDDKTRVDCLTDTYAIEVDFATKWAEGIGQALYYAEATKRRPGVLLIMEKKTDARYLKRLDAVADEYFIKVWTTGERGLAMGEYSVWMSNVNPINNGAATPSSTVTTYPNLSDAREEAASKKNEFHWIRIYNGKIPKGELIEYYQGGRLRNPDGTTKR